MDAILHKFRNDAIATLGSNLICLLHHGSRAKGEAYPESDYDVIVIVKNVNEKVLKTFRSLLGRYPRFSTYFLSLNDVETLPKAHLLEFMYTRPLYGKISISPPTPEEVRQYISHCRRGWLDTLRHTLLFTHPLDRKARSAYYLLKSVYIYLSYLAFCESGKLPPTRKQTIAYFQKRKDYSYGVKLLKILDNWSIHKDKVAKDPDRYLFWLERFFRNVYP